MKYLLLVLIALASCKTTYNCTYNYPSKEGGSGIAYPSYSCDPQFFQPIGGLDTANIHRATTLLTMPYNITNTDKHKNWVTADLKYDFGKADTPLTIKTK